MRAPSYRLAWGRRTEVVVRRLTERSAVILFRFQGEGELEGESFRDDQRGTSVCVHEGDRWRMVLEQSPPIAQP